MLSQEEAEEASRMPDQDTITNQLELLHTHRRTLHQLLKQEAQIGEAFIPPALANGIADARDEIARLKADLRRWDVRVEDEPADAVEETALLVVQPVARSAHPLARSPALWIVIGVVLTLLISGGVALVSRYRGVEPSAITTPGPTTAPTIAASAIPTAASAPTFLTRYPLNVEALDQVELAPQPGVSTAMPITDTLRVTQV